MVVCCCQSYEKVRVGDVGRVTKLENGDLHDLNVQADWVIKDGTYWVKFVNCQLAVCFKPGDKVRVKPSIRTPR